MNRFATGIILSGGLNLRFEGKNKALAHIGGRSQLELIIDAMSPCVEEIILVTKDPSIYLDYDIAIAADIADVQSSLTGICTGLFYCTTPYAFVTACDTPFLKTELIRLLFDHTGSDADIVIPCTTKGLEPLCAVYSKRCFSIFYSSLLKGRLAIREAFPRLRLKQVLEEDLREVDSDLISFTNINSQQDLDSAREKFL